MIRNGPWFDNGNPRLYPAINAKLGAAMLNHQFGTQFAIRRGSLLRKQAGGVIEPEGGADCHSPTDESRPADPTLVETITNDESVSAAGGDGKVEQEPALGTHTLPSLATGGNVKTTIDLSTATELGAALTMLPSGVEARSNEQSIHVNEQSSRSNAQTGSLAARFDEQAARSYKQDTRLCALQSDNASRSRPSFMFSW